MKKWLFNPFFYVAGSRSLIIGWLIMLATACIAYYSHAHFDGVIDMHVGRVTPMPVYFYEQLIDWGCLVLILYPAGLIFSRSSIRFIDVAGTLALARWPMIICAILAFGIKGTGHMPVINNTADAMKLLDSMLGTILLAIFVVLPVIIWFVALMYNAFKLSCNIKAPKSTMVFIPALIIAEVLSHLLLYILYKHFI